ncbi:MAG: peptide deformylase [Proteobacteria bacterium]|nr:peptide deformylase [Pseudomonadota bacterium]
MAIRKVVYYPHPVLLKVAEPVEQFDDALQTLIDDMFDTMYAYRGVGLAAPQIAIAKRLAVVDHIGDKKETYVLINPEIIEADDWQDMEEGCLSVPSAYDAVKRPNKIKIRALDRHGKVFEKTAEGLLAEVFQHEIDHLDGKLFIHLLSNLKRSRAIQKLEKYKKQSARRS